MEVSQAIVISSFTFTTITAPTPPLLKVSSSATRPVRKASTNLPMFSLVTFHVQEERRAEASTTLNAMYWSALAEKSSRTGQLPVIPTQK